MITLAGEVPTSYVDPSNVERRTSNVERRVSREANEEDLYLRFFNVDGVWFTG